MKKLFLLLIFIFSVLILSINFTSAITGSIGNAVIILTGEVGDSFERNITVMNVNDVPVNITVWTNATNIILAEDKFRLEAGENKSVSFTATIERGGVQEEKINFEFEAENEPAVGLLARIRLFGQQSTTDVAYILKNPSYPNTQIISSLNELNLSYSLIDDSQITSTNFSNYEMLVMGDENFGTLANSIPVNQKNALFLSRNHVDEWHWANGYIARSTSQAIKGRILINNSITKNFSSPVTLTTSGDSYYVLPKIPSRARSIDNVISTDTFDQYPILASVEPGDVLLSSYVSRARGVYFGLTNMAKWNNNAKEIFKRAIMWVLTGDDRDGDGFFTDEDCNDNNAEVWQLFPGYVDNDADNYGTGSLLNVCSGDSLLQGYSEINGDCNDNNAEINPDAEEIPYDSLDNDCSGEDLADLDNDEYCLAGYYIQNKTLQCNLDSIIGSDCNDEEEGIHPLAYDPVDEIDQNCVNDAPIFSGFIPNHIWYEDSSVLDIYDLDNYFSDREGDILSYSVEGNVHINISIEGSLVGLIPDENWYGSEKVRFVANDGNLSKKSNNVTLTVIPVNDAPVLQNIPDIKVVEGSLVKIIPITSDVDGDTLHYSFSSPLNSVGEWQTYIGDVGVYYINVGVSDGNLADSQEVEVEVLPKLVINEFVSIPLEGEEEWIEIYNPHNYSLSLNEFTLEDGTGNIDELFGTINAYGFFIFYPGFILNNNGDIIILKNSEIEADKVAYGNWDDGNLSDNAELPMTGESAARIPDGKDTDKDNLDFFVLEYPTKGISNSEDLTPPVVTLISPANGSFFNVDYVLFNFSASDNKALILNCSFYSDVNGNFGQLASLIAVNNSIANFWVSNIDDGNYLWNVKCSDGLNEAFGLSNWSFEVNEPDAPVLAFIGNKTIDESLLLEFSINANDADGDVLYYSANYLPLNAVFDSTTRTFSWTPSYEQAGSYVVEFIVSDGLLEDRENATITVRNTNRVPVLLSEIPNQSWNEDESTEINLSEYFSDPDNDSLSYSVSGNNNINVNIINGIVTLSPSLNWFGTEQGRFVASDGSLNVESNLFNLVVLPVNDAPVLQNIPDITANENEIVEIIAHASDVENDTLTYSINDSRFTQNNNVFEWQTNYNDEGIYYFAVSVSDGLRSDLKQVKVTVNRINEPPHILPLENTTINEDSGIHELALSAYDNDGNISRFTADGDDNKVKCRVTDNLLGIEPAKDFFGSASCNIRVYDNENAYDETTLYILVENVNDAPIIDSVSPGFNPAIPENGAQHFSIIWHDIDNLDAEVSVKWYVNGNFSSIGNGFDFNAQGKGNYDVKAVISDLSDSTEHEWNVLASEIPITTGYDGDTTDFSGMINEQLSNIKLVLEKTGKGKIEFLDLVDLRDVVDFVNFADIKNLASGIDTNILTALKNKRARLSFYNLPYNKTPTIYYNSNYLFSGGIVCPDNVCTNINYENHNLIFDVSGFSTFMIGETRTCSQKSGFVCPENEICQGNNITAVDSNSCCSIRCTEAPPKFEKEIDVCENIANDLEITIKKPSEGKEFIIGDDIPIEVKITNHNESNVDLDVEAFLFNINENKVEEDSKQKVDISGNKDENIDLDITTSNKLDADNNYAVFVKVSGDKKCNQDYRKIDINREEDKVIIEKISLNPGVVGCDGNFELRFKVSNIGENDEDVYFTIENSELGINERTNSFELEKAGEHDSETKSFLFNIKDAKSGDYNIKVSAFYEEDTQENVNLKVECEKKEEVTVEKIIAENTVEDKLNKVVLDDNTKALLAIMSLIIGIFFLIIMIVIVARRR